MFVGRGALSCARKIFRRAEPGIRLGRLHACIGVQVRDLEKVSSRNGARNRDELRCRRVLECGEKVGRTSGNRNRPCDLWCSGQTIGKRDVASETGYVFVHERGSGRIFFFDGKEKGSIADRRIHGLRIFRVARELERTFGVFKCSSNAAGVSNRSAKIQKPGRSVMLLGVGEELFENAQCGIPVTVTVRVPCLGGHQPTAPNRLPVLIAHANALSVRSASRGHFSEAAVNGGEVVVGPREFVW